MQLQTVNVIQRPAPGLKGEGRKHTSTAVNSPLDVCQQVLSPNCAHKGGRDCERARGYKEARTFSTMSGRKEFGNFADNGVP